MSTILIPEKDLAKELPLEQGVEAGYPTELADIASHLQRNIPVLVECDKELAPYLYLNLRSRLKQGGVQCLYLDGRPRQADQQAMACGFMGTILTQLRDAVRGAVDSRRVMVLPHLDLMTTSQGNLTTEAREVIPLLYENPEVVWLGFKDPSFSVPKVIENLFPHRLSLLGLSRSRLRHLITQKEARKFGRDFNPWALYKFVSGVNAVRVRKLLGTIEGEDYPADARRAYNQIRQATLVGQLEIPNVDLEKDIGGYAKVKQRLRAEIIDVMTLKEQMTEAEDISRIEELIPKGMIFWGPPGTGKTLFAKAMATAFGAALTVVSGPELKSRWVGESEENLRQIFHRARQSAPAIIVFDEIDSFATARGTYTGSGVEHSMVNQLLTEMDGFHKEEMVFIIGTTNFVECLDPALLRPGRFEFHLYIPYPEADDRREIIKIYDQKMRLKMSDETMEHAVKRTRFHVPGAAKGTYFSGDHLNALCRAVARIRLRENRKDETKPEDVERALTEWHRSPPQTPNEQRVIATHEAGHAVCHLFMEHLPPIDRISLSDDVMGAEGYVMSQEPVDKRVLTHAQLLDHICVAMGGREAEKLILGHESAGADGDITNATGMARAMVELHGMGGEGIGFRRYYHEKGRRQPNLSQAQVKALDRRINQILAEQQERAARILRENRPLIETLRDLLIEKQVIDAKTLGALVADKKQTG
jgi:cell division protease FtsH